MQAQKRLFFRRVILTFLSSYVDKLEVKEGGVPGVGTALRFPSNLACKSSLVAGAWTEREKMYHGGSFLKLADDNMDIQNPEAQNRELSGF